MSSNVQDFVLNLHIAMWEFGLHVRIPNIEPSTPTKSKCMNLAVTEAASWVQ